MNIAFLAASAATEAVTENVFEKSMDLSTPLGERMTLGLQTMVLGLGTVFSILIIIWGVLALFKVFFYTIPNSRKKKASAVVDTQTENVASEEAVDDNDEEIVAVISAAVAVYLDKPVSSFRVVSFRRFDKQ